MTGPLAGHRMVRLQCRLYLTPEEFARYTGIESIEIRIKERLSKESCPDDDQSQEPIVTKTGRVLTADDIQELADEAERGYDLPKPE